MRAARQPAGAEEEPSIAKLFNGTATPGQGQLQRWPDAAEREGRLAPPAQHRRGSGGSGNKSAEDWH